MWWPLIALAASLARAENLPSPDTVAEAMRGCVRAVAQDFSVFHWEAGARDNVRRPPVATPEQRLAYARARAAEYLDTNTRYGFYFAIDPYVSAGGFGAKDRNWLLIAATVPKGSLFLDAYPFCDLAKEVRPLFPESSLCVPELTNAGQGAVGDAGCQQLKRKVFEKLGIAGIRYGWETSRTFYAPFCADFDHTEQAAFIFTNRDWVRPENLRFYTAQTPVTEETRTEMRVTQMMFRLLGPKNDVALGKMILWPALRDPIPSRFDEDPAVKRWMQSHLYNCLPGKAPTSAP